MKRIPPLLTFAAVACSAWALVPVATATPQPTRVAVTGAPTFLQSGLVVPALLPARPPQPIGALGNSVMPGNPDPMLTLCSITAPGQTECSAFNAGDRCSAFNGGQDVCSTMDWFNNQTHVSCSAFASGAICSTLPPSDPSGNFSICSASQWLQEPASTCSTFSPVNNSNVRCSTKGQGASVCSADDFGNFGGDYACSVHNTGATRRSFCSTKFNQPALAKGCSTISNGANEVCSIVAGGKGVCTSFGAADPGSCSVIGQRGHCSVIGGAGGNPCAQ